MRHRGPRPVSTLTSPSAEAVGDAIRALAGRSRRLHGALSLAEAADGATRRRPKPLIVPAPPRAEAFVDAPHSASEKGREVVRTVRRPRPPFEPRGARFTSSNRSRGRYPHPTEVGFGAEEPVLWPGDALIRRGEPPLHQMGASSRPASRPALPPSRSAP